MHIFDSLSDICCWKNLEKKKNKTLILTYCLSLLQQACGFEYTSKLQRMFQDIGVSKDLNEQFKKHLVASVDPLDSKYNKQHASNGSG